MDKPEFIATLLEKYQKAQARYERFIAQGVPNLAWVAKAERLAKESDRAWEVYRVANAQALYGRKLDNE